MTETKFLNAVFNIVEFLTKNTVSTTSKRLLINYIEEAPEGRLVDQARTAVRRYIQQELPSLEEIRAKSQTEELSKLDHLVLKMEYEATRVR